MAYGNSNPGPAGPSSDMFSDGDGAAPEKKEGMEEEGGEATGILPKSLMAGKDFKVGEEIVLKITHIGEDSFEVEYSKGKDEKSHDDKEPAMAGGGDSGMSGMME